MAPERSSAALRKIALVRLRVRRQPSSVHQGLNGLLLTDLLGRRRRRSCHRELTSTDLSSQQLDLPGSTEA